MAKQSIVIDVAVDGSVTIDAVGFQGKGCAAATKAFEDALGKVTKDTHKPEYRQTEDKQKVLQ